MSDCKVNYLIVSLSWSVASNAIRLEAGDGQPRTRIASPRLAIMEKCIDDLDTILEKLVNLVFTFARETSISSLMYRRNNSTN